MTTLAINIFEKDFVEAPLPIKTGKKGKTIQIEKDYNYDVKIEPQRKVQEETGTLLEKNLEAALEGKAPSQVDIIAVRKRIVAISSIAAFVSVCGIFLSASEMLMWFVRWISIATLIGALTLVFTSLAVLLERK